MLCKCKRDKIVEYNLMLHSFIVNTQTIVGKFFFSHGSFCAKHGLLLQWKGLQAKLNMFVYPRFYIKQYICISKTLVFLFSLKCRIHKIVNHKHFKYNWNSPMLFFNVSTIFFCLFWLGKVFNLNFFIFFNRNRLFYFYL